MSITRKQILEFIRATVFLLIFLIINLASPITQQSHAAGWPGWSAINTIYYNSSQDDATNKFLAKASTELRDHLQKSGKNVTITTASRPASGSIYLEVNAAHPELTDKNEEAFRLYSDAGGIYVTGKTPLAVRHGAYALLEKLGFRWFFEHPAWWVQPDTLVSLDGLNEVREPFYFWRRLYIWSRVSSNHIADWAARNRIYGARDYSFDQNYCKIAAHNNYSGYGSLAALYAAHPEWFVGKTPPVADTEWGLRPDNPGVVALAKAFTRKLLTSAPHRPAFNNDKLPYGAIPVSPNDNPDWNPLWNPAADWQTITDKVYYLANEVAKDIKTDFPGAYVTLLSVNTYAGIPTIPLESNIIAQIVTDFNMTTPLTIDQLIDGLTAKGVNAGIWDLYSEWVYFQDLPFLNLSKVKAISHYAQKGVKVYHSQVGGNAWGVTGITSYTASKMLWDPFQDIDAILNDFYARAFGPAEAVMRRYYGRYQDAGKNWSFSYQKSKGLLPPPSLPATVADSFRDLAEAESLAGGNSIYLERIRQLEYYQRFLWFYHVKGISNLGLNELKAFYTFINKIRDLYIINYAFDEPAIRGELKNRGLTDTEINALQNFTPPTSAEATSYLNEALTAFGISLNSQPVANSQSITTNQDSPVIITLAASDLEGSPLTYHIVSSPAHGTLSGTPPAVTYRPNPGFTGTDTFTFTASDGTATSNSASVTITAMPSPSPTPAPVIPTTATPTPKQTPTLTPTPKPTPTSVPQTDWAVIGGIVAVVIMLGLFIFFMVRRGI